MVASLARSVRAAMRRHQEVPPGTQRSTWRLVVGEVAWLLGQLLSPDRFVPALAAAVLVLLVLGPDTPGPVVQVPWRGLLAALLGVVAGAVGPRVLTRVVGSERSERAGGGVAAKQAVAGIAPLFVLAAVLAVVGFALATVVSLLF